MNEFHDFHTTSKPNDDAWLPMHVVKQMIDDAVESAVNRVAQTMKAQIDFLVTKKLAAMRADLIEELRGAPTGRIGFPLADDVTKIVAQLFDNKNLPKTSTLARLKLRLYVWSCPKELQAKSPNGNHGNLDIALHSPADREGRRKLKPIQHILDMIDQSGNLIKYAGRFPSTEIVAVVRNDDDKLWLIIDPHTTFCLELPKSKPADAKPGAAIQRWAWPDPYRS